MTMLATITGGCRPAGAPVRVANGQAFHRGASARSGGCGSSQKQEPSTSCSASSVDTETVYQGMFGNWSVDELDIKEVYGYRAGISVAALSAIAVCGTMLAGGAESVPPSALNTLCVAGASGFGLSLVLIHIYVTEIKRTIQALFVVGAASGIYLMTAHPDTALPVYVVEHAGTVLGVGPAFAAVTAVAIKEGLCYGKGEAAALALEAESVLAAVFTSIFAVFAVRKYSQAIKDDIGDKSVFTFRKLPEDEQQRVLQEMESSKQR